MEKKHSHKCIPNNSEAPASLGMHKDSKTISKSSSSGKNKPKIRIIHIFAPQIIKTDVENFRELVQRTTGKSPPNDAEKLCSNINNKKKPTTTILAASGGTDQQEYSRTDSLMMSGLISDDDKPKSKNKKMVELMRNNKFAMKEEQVCISDEISSGGYLGGFSDLEEEGFISELAGFSMLPLD